MDTLDTEERKRPDIKNHLAFSSKETMRFALLRKIVILITLVLAGFSGPGRVVCALGAVTLDVEQLDFANGLMERHLYEMARDEYQKFLTSFPESEYRSEALFGLGESYFFSRKYAEAIETYLSFLRKYPDDKKVPVSALRLGQAYFFTDDDQKALEEFQKVPPEKLDKDFRQMLYFYMGKTYRIRGNEDKAVEFFQKAAEAAKSAHTVYAYLEMADIFSQEGKKQEPDTYYNLAFQNAQTDHLRALVSYKKAEGEFSLGRYARSIETFQHILQTYPDDSIAQDALVNLLLANLNLYQYEEVIGAYQTYKKLLGTSGEFLETYFSVAEAYTKLSEYDKALSLLDSVMALKSLDARQVNQVLLKKAGVLLEAKRYEDVLSMADQLAQKGIDPADILFLNAEADYGLEKYEDALKGYQKAVDEFPASRVRMDALYGLAHTQNILGKTDQALESFLKYFHDGKDQTKRQEALLNAMLIASENGQTDRAIELGELFISSFPEWGTYSKVLLLLGAFYSEVKDFKAAALTYQKFVDKFPRDPKIPEAYFYLGYNLQRDGKTDAAMEVYDKITLEEAGKKHFYGALKNKGLILLDKKEDKTAAVIFQRIISEDPENDLDFKIYLWTAGELLKEKKYEDILAVLSRSEERPDVSSQGMSYFRAEALRGLKQYQKAIEQYDRVLSGKDNAGYSGAAHIRKGLCLEALDQWDEAKKEFDRALLESPDDSTVTLRARMELAHIERLKGRPEEAAKLYMMVAVLYKDETYCPRALFQAGEIFEELHREKEAQRVYSEVVEKYPQSSFAELARKKAEAAHEK